MKKLLLALMFSGLAALAAQAGILLQDSLNYPYTNGCIEGQGQWFCYTPATPALDAHVTNNVLYLTTTNTDSVATPTNGFYNVTNGSIIFTTFTINVSQLPSATNGNYFCNFKATNSTEVCNLYIDTEGVQTPGTYRLGVANFATSFSAAGTINYPEDLATNTTYTVVMAFDTDPNSDAFAPGANLWINPSLQDIANDYEGGPQGDGFVYGTDTTTSTNLLDIHIAEVAFSPYVNAGISNVIVGTYFTDVITTNLPVIGIQPLSTTNYSGNSLELFTIASGVDLTYQWYGPSGPLTDDGVNVIGSTSNILVLNNITGATAGNYYVVVTDAYGNTVTSSNAVTTVITTPTAPFFPASVVAENLTANLFTSVGFTNTALGTGPLTYQWYFEPTTTNVPPGETMGTYYPLAGQNSASLNLFLSDYTYQGNYYVAASNSISGALGPVNTIAEIAPVAASISQLHTYEVSIAASQGTAALKSHTVYVNTNNVTVSGYVTTYNGFGKGYTEFNIQDASGLGVEVYLAGVNNIFNAYPVGTYVTVTGPIEIYDTELEVAPATAAAIVTNSAPPMALTPVLQNAHFNDLATNGLGTNALITSMSMVTFTNVYVYGSRTGSTTLGSGGIFYSNSYTTAYFTVGAPYSASNTNTMEIYQFAYSSPYTTNTPNSQFYNQSIPTHLYQLTGAYEAYNGTPELTPSRLADYVITAPAAFSTTLTNAKKSVTLAWPVQTGSTYTVSSTTNLAGTWTTAAYGLGYYPTNGVFTDTTTNSGLKFYKVTSP